MGQPLPLTPSVTGHRPREQVLPYMTWSRFVVDDSVGTGTVQVWSLPDSMETLTASMDVSAYGPDGGELWIWVRLDAENTCEGPPEL